VTHERMTDAEVLDHIKRNTPLNQLRALFSAWNGRIEQAMAQRRSPGPIELRRLEFEAVQEIVAKAGARP